jgi:alpha-L-fucosidase
MDDFDYDRTKHQRRNPMRNPFTFDRRLVRLALVCAMTSIAWSPRGWAQTQYTASWTSLDTHNPAPDWFQDAKFGIYYHWGAFSVPAFESEWYPRNMYNKGDGAYNHHMSTYGDPFSSWPFNDFLTGANDKSGKFTQFAPKLVSSGGNWDPNAWAQIFADAGARFAGPVTEHHDGFSMWDSKVNAWNSVALGPKLNLAKLHADAIRSKGLKLLMSQHTAYNFTGYYQYAPAQNDASLQQLFGQLPKAQEETIWLGKLEEIIDEFMPDVIWQDFNLTQISDTNLMNFLAYYYNAALAANKEVVATAKDGITSPHKGQVFDYERGGPADITTPYWLTDDAVSPSSWCYTTGMGYYSSAQMVGSFIDRVSKGGNLLLNISPTWDGTIPQQQKDILAAFGTFLKQMGTAIYNTRAWAVYGEGPTKMGGGAFTQPTVLTSSDIRYTKSKDGDAVYAIIGGWPGNGKQVNLTAVTTSRFPLGSGKVFLFGPTDGGAIELQATQDSSGLHVTLPSTQPYTNIAYAIKISQSGTVPAPTPWIGGTTTDGGAGGAGGSGGADGGGAVGGSPGTGGSGGAGGVGGATTNPSSTGGVLGGGGVGATGGARSSGGATGAGGSSAAGGASGGGASGSTAAGGSGGGASGGTSGNSGAGGSAGASGHGGNGGTSASGGNAGSGGGHGGSGTTTTASSNSTGCTCAVQGTGRSHAGASLLALGLIVASLVRRRRHRRQTPGC